MWCAGQALSRSYGRFFAEFLKDPSLVRLGLLDLTTCVGFGTEPLRLCLEVFLGSVLPKFTRPKPRVQTQLGLTCSGFTYYTSSKFQHQSNKML